MDCNVIAMMAEVSSETNGTSRSTKSNRLRTSARGTAAIAGPFDSPFPFAGAATFRTAPLARESVSPL